MLEAAMFGGIPEGAPYPFSFPTRGRSTHYPRVARPPSPTLTAQRLLREQQVLNSIFCFGEVGRGDSTKNFLIMHKCCTHVNQKEKAKKIQQVSSSIHLLEYYKYCI
jgi:hypothetical protein